MLCKSHSILIECLEIDENPSETNIMLWQDIYPIMYVHVEIVLSALVAG